ncbi:MAG: hypothetical protein Q4C81_04050 [Kocuria sp.]|nr:hypothetical protein [Kocuria sp.]
MEVILAIGPIVGSDDIDDPSLHRHISAEADGYDDALALARESVPDGFRILNIRTAR